MGGAVSSFVSDPLDFAGNFGQAVIDDPTAAIVAGVTENPTALLSYVPAASGGAGPTPQTNAALIGTAGGLMAGQANQAANQQAAQMSQFRPVGITTRFGSSNFQVDPTTGKLTSAGYNLCPEGAGYQTQLSGMTGQGLMQGQ